MMMMNPSSNEAGGFVAGAIASERAPSSVTASLPLLPSGSPRIIYSGSATNDEWRLKRSKARDAGAIANAKAAVGDTRKPMRVYHHLRNNAKRRLADAQERARIERENQRMHERIAQRGRVRPPNWQADDGRSTKHVQYQLQVRSNLRKTEMRRLQAENEAMSARIQKAQQASRNEQEALEEEWQEHLQLLRRVARHPLVIVEEATAGDGAGGARLQDVASSSGVGVQGGAALLDRVEWDTDVHVPLPRGRARGE